MGIPILLFIGALAINFSGTKANPETYCDQLFPLNIYKVNPDSLEDFHVLKKGTSLDLILLNDVSTKQTQENDPISLRIPTNENLNINATATTSVNTSGKRFSKYGSIQLSTNKLILDDGQEVYFSATSPEFTSINPPHADSSSLRLAKTITNLSLATSPITLGSSLGISFLVNGLLSARQNGISDFIWGGLNGVGLPFVEKLFRKQPEVFLTNGNVIPFILDKDLKISKGIQKEKLETLQISNEEAVNEIQNLIKRGDIAGALELSIKTNQKEIYDQLLKKISS
ncbi:MAG: hypothetical protein HY094_09230 [Candidatus Melainabacteria bacterium]|nr:hypothetical protein [Candidatus Melainabacteria bacterium]